MSLEIGPNRPLTPSPAPSSPVRRTTDGGFAARLQAASGAPVDRVELGGIPAAPPAAVLDEVGAAADRVDELAAANRELHFRKDERSGRVIVEVRDLTSGEVVRTIPPSEMLQVMSGKAL